MTEYITLDRLKRDQLATVVAINANDLAKERLYDLGIVPDTKIRCIMKSPLGDPTAYLFRECVIALRAEDSEMILVKPLSEGGELNGTD